MSAGGFIGVWEYEIPLRQRDLDSLGHVTGAAHMDLVVEARSEWLVGVLNEPDPSFIVVRQVLEFHRELRFEARRVVVGLKATRMGAASFDVAETISSEGGLHTSSAATLVRWDRDLRQSKPLTSAERIRMTAYLHSD